MQNNNYLYPNTMQEMNINRNINGMLPIPVNQYVKQVFYNVGFNNLNLNNHNTMTTTQPINPPKMSGNFKNYGYNNNNKM